MREGSDQSGDRRSEEGSANEMKAITGRSEEMAKQSGRKGLKEEMIGLREEEDGLREGEKSSACVCMMNLSHELIVHLSTFLPVTIQHISYNRASRP